MPGRVTRTTSKAPARPFSSSATAPPMSQRANVVSATPTRLRAARTPSFLVTLELLQLLAQLPVLRDLLDDPARAVEVADEVRQAHDLRVPQPAGPAPLQDLRLVVRLGEPQGEHARAGLRPDVVDVPLVPQGRAVHGLQRGYHLDALRLRHDRPVLEPLRGAVARDDHDELVPALLRLGEGLDVTRMQEVEDPRRHHTDHARHASRIYRPSRNTRVRASA